MFESGAIHDYVIADRHVEILRLYNKWITAPKNEIGWGVQGVLDETGICGCTDWDWPTIAIGALALFNQVFCPKGVVVFNPGLTYGQIVCPCLIFFLLCFMSSYSPEGVISGSISIYDKEL